MENKIHIRAFYRFVEISNFIRLKKPFEQFCKAHDMKGTILLAREGINSTISAPKEVMDKFWQFMNQDTRFANMPFKESFSEKHPFEKMKVRLKKEIVRMGVENLDLNKRGAYVKGEEWDKLISDPDVILVDTRNDYEYLLGTFQGAINPKTEDFRSFPQWVEENLDPSKHKKVAMFCTGGIRCEKSTSYLLNKGFKDVYHLDGGILQYFEDTKNKNNKWQGSCYVFDDRLAVNSNLEPVDVVLCKKCTKPLKIEPVKLNNNQKGITCEMIGQKCGIE
jgi:UPF0176 protein